jgi:benzoate membrane transport protein
LAVVGVLINALKQVTKGPLILGPVFAFAVASSKISLLGFGPFFWSLLIGMAVSLLLERDKIKEYQKQAAG